MRTGKREDVFLWCYLIRIKIYNMYIPSVCAFQNTVDEYHVLIVMSDPSAYQWGMAKEGCTISIGGKHTEL